MTVPDSIQQLVKHVTGTGDGSLTDRYTFRVSQTPGSDGVSNGTVNGLNALGADAWGRQKVVSDYSMLHGIWTYDIPVRFWIETYNDVERVPTSATSENKELKLVSNSGKSRIQSKRHLRYQPNRGLLFSLSAFIDGATTSNGTLYACLKTTRNGVTTVTRQAVTLADGFDPSKGNIYDIQAQWRGVGNIKFFINLQECYIYDHLGTLSNLSISNPAISVGFEAENDGTVRFGLIDVEDGLYFEWVFDTPQETTFRAGCVDVTSEGGFTEGQTYLSFSTGLAQDFYATKNSGIGTVVIALRIPDTLMYNGVSTHLARDAELKRFTSAAKADEHLAAVYYIRNTTAFDAVFAANASKKQGSQVEFMLGGTNSGGTFNIPALQTAFEAQVGNMELLTVRRGEIDTEILIDNPDVNSAPFFISSGDYIFAVLVPDQTTKLCWCNFEVGEEI